jgi:RNA polymerase sigma factor (sigma-70 family)
MALGRISEIIQHLRRTVSPRDGAGLSDGQLLEDYVRNRDETALAALVWRHGAMVWGVCRRILRNCQDAEDAFQATFLVLLRKAASVVPRERLANWLYGVAYQTALKARATAAKRRARETQMVDMPEPAFVERDRPHDLQDLLDQELIRLPFKYRIVVLLCDLEGRTRKEAARQLGVPEGTVAGRLARARVMLTKRLVRQSLPLSGGTLAAALSEGAAPGCMPASLANSTIKIATSVAAGQATTGIVSVKVAALAEGVLKAMLLTKLKTATGTLLVLAVGIGMFFLIGSRPLSQPAQAAANEPTAPGLSGKPAYIGTKDGVNVTVEKIEVRQLGGRAFLVGREVTNSKITKAQFSGGTIWVPVDAIKELVELQPEDAK